MGQMFKEHTLKNWVSVKLFAPRGPGWVSKTQDRGRDESHMRDPSLTFWDIQVIYLQLHPILEEGQVLVQYHPDSENRLDWNKK